MLPNIVKSVSTFNESKNIDAKPNSLGSKIRVIIGAVTNPRKRLIILPYENVKKDFKRLFFKKLMNLMNQNKKILF